MRESLETLRREIEVALDALYLLKAFKELLVSKENVRKINENCAFWQCVEISLNTQIFISLRRIFESENDTFNFSKYKKLCLENINLFCIAELRKRKEPIFAGNVNHLNAYMECAFEPSESDFKELFKYVKSNSKNIHRKYLSAASKIYAHAVHTNPEEINVKLKELNYNEIEASLLSVWHCYMQVLQLYENGKKPSLVTSPYPYSEKLILGLHNVLGIA